MRECGLLTSAQDPVIAEADELVRIVETLSGTPTPQRELRPRCTPVPRVDTFGVGLFGVATSRLGGGSWELGVDTDRASHVTFYPDLRMNVSVAPVLEHISALSDPTRCRMLLLLEHHELTVGELCAVLQMPQSSVSRHLKTLADDGWVISRRDGTSRFYGMGLEDLDQVARQLWPIIRDQVAATTAAAHDTRRLRGVLTRRRAKSRAFFASAAGQWDKLRENLFGDTFYLWAVLGLIDPALVVGDLGCGTGQLSQTIAPYVKTVVAVDASSDMLDAARLRLGEAPNVDIRQGELERLPIENGELHAAMLSLVLHYSPDPARALTEVARALRPGGRVLVVDMLPHDRQEYQQQMGHVWLGFSEKQITKFLAGAGFGDTRLRTLPVDPDAKGPALFAAIATRNV